MKNVTYLIENCTLPLNSVSFEYIYKVKSTLFLLQFSDILRNDLCYLKCIINGIEA